jgi:hypothetical protein
MATNWKRKVPTSYTQALRLCKDYAKDKHNLSVERIADEMGVTADLLYKWLAHGSMPLNKIRTYQLACKCNFVSRYLAYSEGCMLVPIPSGRGIDDTNMMKLNASFHAAMTLLADFYQDKANAQETIAALTEHMEATGWHRLNIEKRQQPELGFGEDE